MVDVIAVQLLILAVSLIVLALASHFAIGYIEMFMEFTGLSEASAGFVILSLVTTLPEVTVAVFALLDGVPELSVGDILGSHVFNIGIVVGILGVSGAFRKFATEPIGELVDLLFLASIVPLLLVISRVTVVIPFFANQIVGIALLAVFGFSVYEMIKKRSPASADHVTKTVGKSQRRTFLFIVTCSLLVVFASRLVVSSAVSVASQLGILPVLIGAKIVAVGTSLPELAFGLAAVKRGRVHLVLANVIGANLATITLVLGIVLMASSFSIGVVALAEILLFVLTMNVLLWRFLTKSGISQVGGIVLIMVYVLFQAVI